MKKLAGVLFVCIVIIFSCTRKAAPTIPNRPVEPVAGNKADTADFNSSNPLVAGKAIYEIKCTKCHKAKNLSDWTPDEWKPILNSMVKKAKLNDLQISQVTQYVNAHAKK
ncbi:c-type cytochrome [Niabella aurantiaca]|uniref:c-type cytochrome n=1 Tax=Niabella aurantiaca TaxID=379900 RepID=UPI0003636167|nr:cytochrome c [Niabella aurantiaca]